LLKSKQILFSIGEKNRLNPAGVSLVNVSTPALDLATARDMNGQAEIERL
jgi:uncharacterized Fe-S cluster-containing radical SAM superfamily enzyme